MKKSVVGIFAHPDDEAFGPGGTLYLYSKTHDVYVICVTHGEHGNNHNGSTNGLAAIREKELLSSAKILGIKEVFCLDHTDGTLSNNMYKNIADDIQTILDRLQPEIVISFEEKGVTGHIDHIAVSLITHYIFYKSDYIKTLMLFCMPKQEADITRPDYFVYVPEGYTSETADKTVDISHVYETKVRALKEHKSQTKDVEYVLNMQKKLPKHEYFLVKRK